MCINRRPPYSRGPPYSQAPPYFRAHLIPGPCLIPPGPMPRPICGGRMTSDGLQRGLGGGPQRAQHMWEEWRAPGL